MRKIDWKGGSEKAIYDYFYWIIGKIGRDERYDGLLWGLFETEFTWINHLDRHRAEDGLNLRGEFLENSFYRGDIFMEKPCSVLEMMVALSVRIEENVIGDPDLCIFWRMLNNLGLLNEGLNGFEVDILVENWLERRFDRHGNGSICPIRSGKTDQRRNDIWGQMMWFLDEIV